MMNFFQKFTVLLVIGIIFSGSVLAQTKRKNKKTSVKSVSAKTESILTVDFCDLTIHPKLYAGKLLRVDASIVSWWESSYLYNVKCETSKQKIHDGLDCSKEKECESKECESIGKEVYGIIEKNQLADKNNYAFRAYVTLIGRLDGPSDIGFGHLNGFKFEFRIKKVEVASPMPADIPYAKDKGDDSSK